MAKHLARYCTHLRPSWDLFVHKRDATDARAPPESTTVISVVWKIVSLRCWRTRVCTQYFMCIHYALAASGVQGSEVFAVFGALPGAPSTDTGCDFFCTLVHIELPLFVCSVGLAIYWNFTHLGYNSLQLC